MTGKTLSPAEAITQLAQRRTLRAAQATRRRVVAVDPANTATLRPIARPADAVWRHKFRVGETVTLVPNRYGANRLDNFKVMFLLPQEHGVNQYRLKSNTNGHERVADENELS
jgi:hypothetical protein